MLIPVSISFTNDIVKSFRVHSAGKFSVIAYKSYTSVFYFKPYWRLYESSFFVSVFFKPTFFLIFTHILLPKQGIKYSNFNLIYAHLLRNSKRGIQNRLTLK